MLQRQFPLSNIHLDYIAQDKVIHLWDVKRHEWVIEADEERKRQLEKGAALSTATTAVSQQQC